MSNEPEDAEVRILRATITALRERMQWEDRVFASPLLTAEQKIVYCAGRRAINNEQAAGTMILGEFLASTTGMTEEQVAEITRQLAALGLINGRAATTDQLREEGLL